MSVSVYRGESSSTGSTGSASAIQLIFVRRSFLRNGPSAPSLSLFNCRGIWVDRRLIALSPRTTAELRPAPGHIDLAIVYIFSPIVSSILYRLALLPYGYLFTPITSRSSILFTRQDVAPR